MASAVASGLYRFFSLAELDLEKAKFITAVKQSTAARGASGGGLLSGGSLNGQTVNYVFPAGVSSFEEWGAAIQDAYNQLNDEDTVATDRAIARFSQWPKFWINSGAV